MIILKILLIRNYKYEIHEYDIHRRYINHYVQTECYSCKYFTSLHT